jgi:hypothetical protein
VQHSKESALDDISRESFEPKQKRQEKRDGRRVWEESRGPMGKERAKHRNRILFLSSPVSASYINHSTVTVREAGIVFILFITINLQASIKLGTQ